METIAPHWLWATFVAIVAVSLFVDFVVLKKQGAHDIGVCFETFTEIFACQQRF